MSGMKLRYLFLLLALPLLLVPFIPGSATSESGPPRITQIEIGFQDETTRLVISASHPLDYRQFTLSEGGLRYVLDFPALKWDVRKDENGAGRGDGAGAIDQYRFAQNSPTTSRLVLDLNRPVELTSSFTLEPDGDVSSYRIVMDFRPADDETFVNLRKITQSRPEAPAKASDVLVEATAAAGTARPVIVIDPGHGGRDPGAIGTAGTFEKDVNLNAAKALQSLLADDYKVVLTRSGDIFIPHQKRISMARDAGANLFISIHADAAGNADVYGASVYTLSSESDDRVSEVQKEEGWVIPLEVDAQPPELNDIFEDLVKRETVSRSDAFAELLVPELARVGPVLRNSHRTGNLFVLLAPDVPAVLLEVGFLTSPQDEKRLTSPKELAASMQAVANAIDTYFAYQARQRAQQ